MSAINTLFKLLNKYEIEIPIVQRDYAQGRTDEHSISVRKSLLQDMRDALKGNFVLDLNFIYGKIEGQKFIPLDGQQRLTTLFLVHLYAFSSDETKTPLLTKFSYETRTSSRSFLEQLTSHRAEVFNAPNKPSDEIADSSWYHTAWDYDPTVQSIKVVLDDIFVVFSDVNNLCRELSKEDNVPICFSFLPMDELGMEDSLYIKMNARGRMLTPFENFKARLIAQVKKLYEHQKLVIEPREFEKLLDSDWTDLFWQKDRKNFDIYYKSFFDVLFAAIANLSYDNKFIPAVKTDDINSNMVESAYYLLNYLCMPDCQKDVKDIVFACLIQRPSFPQRIMFFAVSAYMSCAKSYVTNKSLSMWLRIIRNLTYNTNEQIGRAENFGAAIQSIYSLSPYWENLTEYFASETVNLKIFAPAQIEEEQIKAALICRNEEFATRIFNAEKHPYFSGQIRSGLLAAQITYEIAHKGDDVLLYEKMQLFSIYWAKIATLFTNREPILGTQLRQALLAQKDYTLKTGSYHSFGIDNPNDPVSLKALWADADQIELIKNLLDSFPSSAQEDIQQSLERAVNNANICENDWRYCFITFPALFDCMSKQYMRIFKGKNTLIVKNKATNGYNYEVFTYALHLVLGSPRSEYADVYGSYGQYFLTTIVNDEKVAVRFENNKFVVTSEKQNVNNADKVIFETKKEPFSEIIHFLNHGHTI